MKLIRNELPKASVIRGAGLELYGHPDLSSHLPQRTVSEAPREAASPASPTLGPSAHRLRVQVFHSDVTTFRQCANTSVNSPDFLIFTQEELDFRLQQPQNGQELHRTNEIQRNTLPKLLMDVVSMSYFLDT